MKNTDHPSEWPTSMLIQFMFSPDIHRYMPRDMFLDIEQQVLAEIDRRIPIRPEAKRG